MRFEYWNDEALLEEARKLLKEFGIEVDKPKEVDYRDKFGFIDPIIIRANKEKIWISPVLYHKEFDYLYISKCSMKALAIDQEIEDLKKISLSIEEMKKEGLLAKETRKTISQIMKKRRVMPDAEISDIEIYKEICDVQNVVNVTANIFDILVEKSYPKKVKEAFQNKIGYDVGKLEATYYNFCIGTIGHELLHKYFWKKFGEVPDIAEAIAYLWSSYWEEGLQGNKLKRRLLQGGYKDKRKKVKILKHLIKVFDQYVDGKQGLKSSIHEAIAMAQVERWKKTK